MSRNIWAKIVIILTAFSTLLVPLVHAGETASKDGKFTIANRAPESVSITAPADMTPLADTTIDVTVTDLDTLADIASIEVILYRTSEGTAGGGHVQDRAVLTWTSGGTPEWTIDPSGTTWAINAGQVPANMALTTGTWQFSFKPGKVATQATNGWSIRATATDTESAQGQANSIDSVSMNWYGEIALDPLLTLIDWGSVVSPSGFADNVNEVTGISATYICNSNYFGRIQSAGNWSGATLDPTGACTSADQFAIRAYYQDSFGSSALVATSAVTIYDLGTQTGEAGNEIATHTLWLRVADAFSGGTFQGAITYLIASSG